MEELLLSLGVNVGSSAIYDYLKTVFLEGKTFTKSDLENKLSSFLNIQNSNIIAETIIDFLAKNGDIRIEGTSIYANDSISISSSRNTKIMFGNGSSSLTKNTKIEVGNGAFIQSQGGAGIKQNEDGSISFFT